MQTGAQAAPHDPQQQQQQPDATAVPDEQHPAAAEDLDAEDAAAATSDDEDDDDDYNQRNFGIFQALPVDGEPDWSLTEPDTAEEYLRRVRYEAARCPQVVRVEPSSSQLSCSSSAPASVLPEPEGIADAPEWAKPNRSWVQQFVADFQQLRLEVQHAYEQRVYPTERVPHVHDVEGWNRACFGGKAADAAAEGAATSAAAAPAEQAAAAVDDSEQMTQLSPGICRKIMALDQPDIISLFLRHAQQLQEACPDSLPLARAQWLFALAARLEKPCHPEVGAAFRAVLRHCCRLRAGVSRVGDPLLPKLNVLIVTAGCYFAQDETLCGIVDSSELL